jgi:hypothetical protein
MSLLGLNGLVHRVSEFSEHEAHPPARIEPEPGVIQATINGITVNLRFKNSGNNDVNDIETYLQEKLDVLEFIQMDCNKMEISQLAAPRMTAPKLLETSSLNRSSLRTENSAPFFIGTPTAEELGINLPLHEEVVEDEDPLNESNLQWETSSVLSSRSVTSRSSRRRSLSNSSVSSNSSLRKPAVGMFGRGRMARLANNMSFSRDENSEDSLAPSSWW